MTDTSATMIDRLAPRIPPLDDMHDESLHPDPQEPTFEIPLGRRRSIGIVLRPGWWVIVAAPLTFFIAVAVISYCGLTTRGPL